MLAVLVALWEELQIAQPTITAVWPLLVVGHELMDGLSVLAVREQIALAVIVTTEHEEDIRVAAEHLEELLTIAPSDRVASVRLGCVRSRIVRTRAVPRIEIIVGHDDSIVPWMAPQHTRRPPKHHASWPVLQTNDKHRIQTLD